MSSLFQPFQSAWEVVFVQHQWWAIMMAACILIACFRQWRRSAVVAFICFGIIGYTWGFIHETYVQYNPDQAYMVAHAKRWLR